MFVRNPRPPLVRLVMVLGAIGLFVAGYYWGNQYKRERAGPPTIEGVLVRPAAELPELSLMDADGHPFTAENLYGRWTLLAFGDLARARGQIAATRMIAVHNRLATEPDLQERLQLALAAAGQSPALARDFSRLSRSLKMLDGETADIERLRTALGDDPRTAPPDAASEAPFFLIDPRGRLTALFPAGQDPAAIASDLQVLEEHPRDAE